VLIGQEALFPPRFHNWQLVWTCVLPSGLGD
jgi:hypothetical protein